MSCWAWFVILKLIIIDFKTKLHIFIEPSMYFLGNLVKIVGLYLIFCSVDIILLQLFLKVNNVIIFTMNKEECILCLHIQNQILQQTSIEKWPLMNSTINWMLLVVRIRIYVYSKTSKKWTPLGPEKMLTFERCSLFVIYHKLVYKNGENFGLRKSVHILEVFTCYRCSLLEVLL